MKSDPLVNAAALSRRQVLLGLGATLSSAGLSAYAEPQPPMAQSAAPAMPEDATQRAQAATRAQRMEWWHAARFGMFIHIGVYSVIERKEWILLEEAMPLSEYESFVPDYQPAPDAAKTWARLARQSGMHYMVLTAKHHEGFCNFNSRLTPYNSVAMGPRRDLVQEYVAAARAEGMRVGIYYSLMDWHHPDGARCAHDEAARRRFVDYTHGLIRELLTNYGKIDILWYDMPIPLDAQGWESQRMNEMVFALQPEIIVNDRNKLPGDYGTPEQTIGDASIKRAWESCMTINESWGYERADLNWKDSRTILRNLIDCSAGGGNYLLNIGPRSDGSVPAASVEVLREVGVWIEANRESVFDTDLCSISDPFYASYSQKGNILFMHIHFWPGRYVAVPGLTTEVRSVKYLKTGKPVQFEQKDLRLRLLNLPLEPPDSPITTFAIECAAPPKQDVDLVSQTRVRLRV
jgi:alpha-L-fucosidase